MASLGIPFGGRGRRKRVAMSFSSRWSPLLRWGGGLALAAGLGAAALPVMAQTSGMVTYQAGPCTLPNQAIQLDLASPSPGDAVGTGKFVLPGYAYDRSATSGTGIDSVTVSLGSQDSGGQSLGQVTLGTPNPRGGAGSQFATAGFTITSAQVPNQSGANTIFVYAHSAVSGQTAVLQVPIVVVGNGGQRGTATPTLVFGFVVLCL